MKRNIFSMGWSRRALLKIDAILLVCAGVVTIIWMGCHLGIGIYELLMYYPGETREIIGVALARQALWFACLIYGVCLSGQAISILTRHSKKYLSILQIRRTAIGLVILGFVLQLLSLSNLITDVIMAVCLILQALQLVILSRNGKGRRRSIIAVSAYLVIGLLMISYCFACRLFELPARENGISTHAAENESVTSQLWQMSYDSVFYHTVVFGEVRKTRYDMTVIPGVVYADTLSKKDGEKATCTSMTPQGIAITDEYIYVSEYCHVKKHNTIIIQIDKKTRKPVKQIVLSGTPHAGGLAYDSKNRVLWIATSMKVERNGTWITRGAVSCLTQKQIDDYDFEKTHQPISYAKTCPVKYSNVSFLTYRDGCLYLGYFSMDKNIPGKAACYEVDKSGIKIAGKVKQEALVPGKTQGMVFYGDKLVFTISYGLHESKMQIYDCTEGFEDFYHIESEKTINLPQKLEQISIDHEKAYALFESSSYAYRSSAPICMDHIVTLHTGTIEGE